MVNASAGACHSVEPPIGESEVASGVSPVWTEEFGEPVFVTEAPAVDGVSLATVGTTSVGAAAVAVGRCVESGDSPQLQAATRPKTTAAFLILAGTSPDCPVRRGNASVSLSVDNWRRAADMSAESDWLAQLRWTTAWPIRERLDPKVIAAARESNLRLTLRPHTICEPQRTEAVAGPPSKHHADRSARCVGVPVLDPFDCEPVMVRDTTVDPG